MPWIIEVTEPYENAPDMVHSVMVNVPEKERAIQLALDGLDAGPGWPATPIREVSEWAAKNHSVGLNEAKLLYSVTP